MDDISNNGTEPGGEQPEGLHVRQRVQAAMAAAGLSQKAVSKEIGYSDGAISQWLRGQYTGDNAELERKAEQWLQLREQRSQAAGIMPTIPTWFEGPSAASMMTAIAAAHITGDMACVYGGPGVGKTTTLRRYRDMHPRVWLATMAPHCNTPVPALQEIAEALGIREVSYTGARPLHRIIVRTVTNTGGCLLIDEAQHLGEKCLDQIRAIHDETGLAIVLVGNETVYSRLTGGSRAVQHAQLFSRIGGRRYVAKPAAGDVQAMAEAWGIADPAIVNYLAAIAAKPGALRGATKTLRLAAMNAGGVPEITLTHLQRAWANLGADR